MTPVETATIGGGAIDILSGIHETNNAILEFIDKTVHRYDVYTDSITPSFIFNNEEIREKILEFKNKKGGDIRYITEITKQNIGYCKEMMKAVELRHIHGPRGVFRVNETEYQYNAVLDDSKGAAILIRSNLKEVVSQQQVVFDSLWKRAIPAMERIAEIQQEEIESKENEGSNRIIGQIPNVHTGIDTILDNIKGLRLTTENGERVGITRMVSEKSEYNIGSRDFTPKKVQLWSNSANSEYAVRLNDESEILAATNKEIDSTHYTILVEEADYLEDMKYDWDYALKHWTSNRYHYYNNSDKETKNV